MQDTEWVNAHLTELLAAGQVPLMKLEIYVDTAWVNLCALAGKNYVEGISGSLGGAGMTPNPVGGALSAELSNENSIFHPKHPTSDYKDYLKTGRKIRISIGATYDSTDYYWQRVIGYIDEPHFEALAQKVGISGADYMKLLEDTELRSLDNYWGASEIYSSFPSDGLMGSETYKEADAMTYPAEGEDDYVGNWDTENCNFVSIEEDGGGSTYVGRVTNIIGEPLRFIENLNVGNATAGKEYRVKFKHRIVVGDGSVGVTLKIYQASGFLKKVVYYPTDDWAEEIFYFTASDTGAIKMRFIFGPSIITLMLDQFSIREFKYYWERYYQLPEASKGPYRVLLKQNSTWEDVWQGEEDEGWFHEEATRRVFFDINKEVAAGTDNLKIYYFTAEAPENAVADILVKCGLYADRTEALDAMEYTATEILIDKIWFEPGSTCLDAIKKLCERGGADGIAYRFHFKWDGTPVFKPKPAPETTAFTFTDQKHIASFSNYQDRNEIRNRIVIEGMKQAEPVNKEETMSPELKGEVHNQTSIDTYGERTLTIKNHLFQDQDSINDMCDKLLAERKDPKWYSDVEVPFNPVPLEMGDKMSWKERLSPTLEIAQEGVIRDIKIDNFNTTYKCEVD